MTIAVPARTRRVSSTERAARVLEGPWTRTDVLASAVLVAVGVLLLVGGWFGVAEQASVSDQMMPLNVGIVGLVLFGAGQALWFVRGRRAVGRRLRELLKDGVVSVDRRPVEPEGVLVGGDGRYYHRPQCAMVAGREWSPEPRTVHEQGGRVACGVCRP